MQATLAVVSISAAGVLTLVGLVAALLSLQSGWLALGSWGYAEGFYTASSCVPSTTPPWFIDCSERKGEHSSYTFTSTPFYASVVFDGIYTRQALTWSDLKTYQHQVCNFTSDVYLKYAGPNQMCISEGEFQMPPALRPMQNCVVVGLVFSFLFMISTLFGCAFSSKTGVFIQVGYGFMVLLALLAMCMTMLTIALWNSLYVNYGYSSTTKAVFPVREWDQFHVIDVSESPLTTPYNIQATGYVLFVMYLLATIFSFVLSIAGLIVQADKSQKRVDDEERKNLLD